MGNTASIQENYRSSSYNFRVMEVVSIKKKRNGAETTCSQPVLVEDSQETLRFMQENMDEFITNVIRVKKMEERDRARIEESARMFEANLEPLFTLITKTTGNPLDKLSISLKKALLLIAMDRYKCNRDSICSALGISRDKLDKEISACGIDAGFCKAA